MTATKHVVYSGINPNYKLIREIFYYSAADFAVTKSSVWMKPGNLL